MFKHANGARHRYKKRSSHKTKRRAREEAQKWKDKHYYVRIVERKDEYDVYAFALHDH